MNFGTASSSVSLEEKFLQLLEANLGQNLTQQILVTHLWKHWATSNVAVDDKQAKTFAKLEHLHLLCPNYFYFTLEAV